MIRCSMIIAAVLLCAASVSAQIAPEATLGVYFDQAGTLPYAMITDATITPVYVCAVRAEMMVGGAAFRIAMPDWILFLGESYPDGLPIGDVMSGLELGLTTPLPVFGTGAAVLATIMVLPPDYPFAVIEMLPHPSYAEPMLADSAGVLYEVDGQPGHMTHPDPAEERSWGEVKSVG